MGRGPPEAIVRKLIRKYFKFDLRRSNFDSVGELYSELNDSWNKHGMVSKESAAIQAKIDLARSQDDKDYIEFRKTVKSYPTLMNQMLLKPKNKHLKRGKQHLNTFHRSANYNGDDDTLPPGL